MVIKAEVMILIAGIKYIIYKDNWIINISTIIYIVNNRSLFTTFDPRAYFIGTINDDININILGTGIVILPVTNSISEITNFRFTDYAYTLLS